MSQSAKDRRVLNFRRSYSSEDETEPRSGVSERLDPQVEPAALQLGARAGPRLWCSAGLAVLASAAAMAAAGCFCALTYPIIKELRTETVRGHDGTEQGILGFWSILVLAVFIGCICSLFSWALTCIDSPELSRGLVLSPTEDKWRDASDHDCCLGHGVAVLNGIMGFCTVIWSLS